MRTVQITWADGSKTVTAINGTIEEIRAYYVGQKFQRGDTDEHPEDLMLEAVAVDELPIGCPGDCTKHHDVCVGNETLIISTDPEPLACCGSKNPNKHMPWCDTISHKGYRSQR